MALRAPAALNTESDFVEDRGMEEFWTVTGKEKTEITLRAHDLGNDLVVYIFNANAHIGALAIGEYDQQHRRTSVSVHTRLGHRDDAIAQRAAYQITKSAERTVCVIAGVHLEGITSKEIEQILANADAAVKELISRMGQGGKSHPR